MRLLGSDDGYRGLVFAKRRQNGICPLGEGDPTDKGDDLDAELDRFEEKRVIVSGSSMQLASEGQGEQVRPDQRA